MSISTLRRWDASGKLVADHTSGGHRRYDLAKLKAELFRAEPDVQRRTVAYASVSSRDQKDDLERQKRALELYCARQGWTFEVIADLGSGINDRKKGLRRLLDLIIEGQVGRLVITHKDRLLRFGAKLVFAICEAKNVEVVILNQGEDITSEDGIESPMDMPRARRGARPRRQRRDEPLRGTCGSVERDIINALGGTKEVAKLCNVRPPSVSQWRKNGIPGYRLDFLRLARPDVFARIDTDAPIS